MNEIEDEIARLEHGKTTYSACEKLSVLYAVRDKFGTKPVEVVNDVRYSFAAAPKSEFLEAVAAAPIDGVLGVLDEHMSAVKSVYPKEYAAVLRMIRELNI